MSRLLATGLIVFLMATMSHAAENENNELSYDGSEARVYKTIGDDVLKIHIFRPAKASDSPRPAIVFFFGGGWKSGSPTQFEQHCRYLAERGMVAMTADYRVASRHGSVGKDCVADAKSAIRWVREHAKELNVDPNRIAAGGGSAGGHLAACTAIIRGWDDADNQSSVPNALVLFNPALALAPFEGQEPFTAERKEQVGDLSARMGTDPENLSPAHHVREGLPPTIMFFGTGDFLLDGAKYFDKQMKAAGNRCEFKLYDGHVHGFFNFGRHQNEPFRETLIATDQFLQSLGYLDENQCVEKWMSAQ